MFQLRQIISLVFISLVASLSFAAAGSFETTFEWNNVQGTRSNPLVSEDKLTSSQIQNFTIISPTLNKNWTLSAHSKMSDNKIEIRDLAGNTKTLQSGYDPKNTEAGISLNFAKEQYSVTANVSQTVSRSPISEKKYELEMNSHFLYSTAEVGLQLEHNFSDHPYDTYFDAVTFKNNLKPRTAKAQKNTLHYEQIFNDNLKSRLELSYSQRNSFRPSNMGADLKSFFAFDSIKSIRFDIGGVAENQKETLPMNQYGYYKMSWAELQYQHNLTYNFSLMPSYSLISEVEETPWNKSSNQLATDVYGLQMKYMSSVWQAQLKYEYSESNNRSKSEQFLGGITWEI